MHCNTPPGACPGYLPASPSPACLLRVRSVHFLQKYSDTHCSLHKQLPGAYEIHGVAKSSAWGGVHLCRTDTKQSKAVQSKGAYRESALRMPDPSVCISEKPEA